MESIIEAKFESPLNLVWSVVTNNNDISWRSDLRDLVIIDEYNFIEINRKGYEVHFLITQRIEPTYYEFEIKSKNSSGTWKGYFSDESGVTTIKFVENIDAPKAIMRLLLKPYLKKHQRTYIRDLKRKLSEM